MKQNILSLFVVTALTACGGSNNPEQIGFTPNEATVPEFTGDFSGLATKDAETGNPNGQVIINDATPGESQFYPVEIDGTYGDFSFNASGEWAYTLWRGNESSDTPEHPEVTALVKAGLPDLMETFTVKTADGTEKQFTVTIRGIDEPATFSGDIATKLVQRDTGKGDTSGTVSVGDANPEEAYFIPVLEQPNTEATDVDGIASITTSYGEVTIKLVTSDDGLATKVDWTYDLDEMNEAVIALVDATESLDDTFTLISADGTEQEVTILVKGSDQVAATFAPHTNLTANEDGTFSGQVNVNDLTLSSALAVTDPNFEEAEFVPLTAAATAYGSVTIDADGLWTYNIDHSKDEVQALLYSEATDTPPTIMDTLTFSTIDGTQAIVAVTIEGAQVAPAVISGYPTVTDNVSSSTVHIKGLEVTGALTITDENAWQESFSANTFNTTYGSFSISSTGAWSYTLSNDAVELIKAGTLSTPFTEQIKVTSFDGTEVTLPISIIGLDQIPPNHYLQLSSKNGTQGIINIDGFGKEKKGKLTLDVRMTNGPYIGYLQLFGANSNNPAVAMVDLQLKPSGVLDIRDITDEDPTVTYTAGEWFPVEMTWDSTQTPAQMTVKVDGKLVSDFASPTTADVSAGAFRMSFRCGRGSDSPPTMCHFDNIKVTQDTASGEKVAVDEDFQGFDLGDVNKSADTPLSSGGKIKKHTNGYQHKNSEILEEPAFL